MADDHRNTLPPDPRSLIEEFPDPIADLILRLLAKSPDERPTAAAVAEVLDPYA